MFTVTYMEATPLPATGQTAKEAIMAHTLATKTTVAASPATEDGALDGFKATCHGCGHSAAFSIRSMTETWAADHVRLMTGWGK